MFWKVPGFSQPSPIENVLDREDFTLDELLDEDDLVQEAKSLNGRLIAFLRKPSSVEQLVRYLVEPQDSDDPKKTYKYPFAACEVLCCELEAVFNTLVEEADLMKMLFSLLNAPPPLNSKVAGYFGRVVDSLLVRKSSEMLLYFQVEGNALLEKLVAHVGTTSVADVVKRMVGADDLNSLMPSPALSQWLSATSLIDLLLSRLSSNYSAEAQANAADILSATAHAQPSPLASKLAQQPCIATLIQHALSPGRRVLVPALDVCIALLEPQRPMLVDAMGVSLSDSMSMETTSRAKNEAAAAIVQHLPPLVKLLSLEDNSEISRDCSFGVLSPPLGRHRLKIVELLAVLVRSGCVATEEPFVQCSALSKCLQLFTTFPFNNLLHHSVASMLLACISSLSGVVLQNLFEDCSLLDWIVQLPQTVVPIAVLGLEEQAAAKTPLRAGYLGHITQVAAAVEVISLRAAEAGPDAAGPSRVAVYARSHEGWLKYVEEVLHPQQDLENTGTWACGRPAAPGMAGLDSDGDEFQNELDLDHITGMQQPLYNRYNTVENEEDEAGDDFKAGPFDFSAGSITEGMTGMDIHGMYMTDQNQEETFGMDDTGPADSLAGDVSGGQAHSTGIDHDDDVLLATSDEESPECISPEALAQPGSTSRPETASLGRAGINEQGEDGVPQVHGKASGGASSPADL